MLISPVCGCGVPVEALIVMVRAADLVIKQQPEAVAVVARHQLTRWLLPGEQLHWLGMLEAVDEVAGTSPMP